MFLLFVMRVLYYCDWVVSCRLLLFVVFVVVMVLLVVEMFVVL